MSRCVRLVIVILGVYLYSCRTAFLSRYFIKYKSAFRKYITFREMYFRMEGTWLWRMKLLIMLQRQNI